MADFESSLPIRTVDAGDVDVFLSDATIPAQKLKVNADGSIDTNASLPAGTKVIITDGTEDLEVNADGSINSVVTATELDVRDLVPARDEVKVRLGDEAGVAYDSSNPLPVELFQSVSDIFSFETSASLAKNASENHDYTTLADFKLNTVYGSASGRAKFELQIESGPASGIFNTVAVAFNSTAIPQVEFKFRQSLTVLSGAIVRIIKTNLDNQAQFVYTSIIGVDA